MTDLNYREGDIFVVPLRNGGFSVGVIARSPKDGKVLLGYFFRVRSEWSPNMTLPKLEPKDAVKVARFGDLAIIKGNWRIIGRVPEWNRAEWKMPKFLRKDDLAKCAWLVTYADDDPNEQISIEACPFDATGYEKDSLLGAGFVEMMLTRLP